MHNGPMARKPGPAIRSLLQRILFSFEQFGRNEMANHAAAGAYGFLLSAIPAILVIVFASSRLVASFDPETILRPLAPFFESFGGRDAMLSFLSSPLAGFTGAFGVINLVWAARLFIVSIQRGIRVAYSDVARSGAVRDNLLTFAVELVIIVAVVLIISASQVARAAISAIHWAPAAAFMGFAVKAGFHALPITSLWLFVFLTYARIPPKPPRLRTAAASAALCVASYVALAALLGLTLNVERYGLLYGILGNLIVGLIKVYFFFWLYFFFVEVCYTTEHLDPLLFARFHGLRLEGKAPGRLERALFSEPERLFRRYARRYEPGETVFRRGDTDRSALYLYEGTVDIYLEASEAPGESSSKDRLQGIGDPLSTVSAGEFFGEMAWILEEPRSAFAIARGDCTIFELPPEVFESFLAQDASATRRLAELLAARLKANNERFSKAGAP